MTPHRLNPKVGAIVMLLRNFSITQGLCNGIRLEASVISGSHANTRVLIPQIKLDPNDANIPFVLHRTQFPVRLSYSITINKAQGQTLDRVGIHLPQPCFTHGQLYVAFLRSKAMNKVRVKIGHLNEDVHGKKEEFSSREILYVYKEIL